MVGNLAGGPAVGGAAGSGGGLGGALFVQPSCQGASGCKSAFAVVNATLLGRNFASKVISAPHRPA